MILLLKRLNQWMRRSHATDTDRTRSEAISVAPAMPGGPTGSALPVGDMSTLPAPRVSLLLYIAGLVVTLSGIYAVNFGLEDPAFAFQSYGLVCAGYAFSYFLRVRGISLQSIQIPLSVCIILALLAGISGNGIGWMLPSAMGDNHLLTVEIGIAWIAIIHTFLMASDASVLFGFVPASSMLALVSTMSTDPKIQDAFLVLIGAGTFLTIHEMYMRTRPVSATQIQGQRESRMYGWQILLTVVCLSGALLLANFIALPIRTIGQAFFDPANNPGMNNTVSRFRAPQNSNVQVNESSVLNLASGPTPELDTPLMKVHVSSGLYWRGATFSTYTGHAFINDDNSNDDKHATETLTAERDSSSDTSARMGQFETPDSPIFNGGMRVYKIPPTPYEIPPAEMRDSHVVPQRFTLLGGNFSSLYGADSVLKVTSTLAGLTLNPSTGALSAQVPSGLTYDVESQVPCGDPTLLQRYTQDGQDGKRVSEGSGVPAAIRDRFLQVPPLTTETEAVKQLALECIRGKKSDYARAEAIRAYIAAHCKYNLQAPAAPHNHDVVAWFMLTSREGYCDSFAAATLVMCRYAGLPTRVASGFLSGDIDSQGDYTVRMKHKHVWVEVFFPRVGWVPFDATDGSEDISDHASASRRKFTSFAAWLASHGPLPPLMCTVLLICLGYVLKAEVWDRYRLGRADAVERQPRSANNQAVVEAYLSVYRLLERVGLTRPPYQTPQEYLKSVSASTRRILPGLGEPLTQLTRLHGVYRYSRQEASEAEVAEARAAMETIRLMLKSVSRRDLMKESRGEAKVEPGGNQEIQPDAPVSA